MHQAGAEKGRGPGVTGGRSRSPGEVGKEGKEEKQEGRPGGGGGSKESDCDDPPPRAPPPKLVPLHLYVASRPLKNAIASSIVLTPMIELSRARMFTEPVVASSAPTTRMKLYWAS